ncbi:DarT ssDNA thymidine ADP-ribosyltransferase family protein [Lichenibacterium dinghuense]|uniref:DarT ssDNA thymidine ADP-ribosyltransferase family protein n=1 Tax=Lichenibacterium dinghuense TaxID=2895977 RepID=UPI001F480E63|nr:DarT ssDNA thymidine ADP-ribosyltransferase family protein [Lichenibacterium sp. 6Y81]
MSMPHTVAELSADDPVFFSVQPLATLRLALSTGSLPALTTILADPAAQTVGVRAHDVDRAGMSLAPPFHGTVGQHVALSVTPRTLAAFASSRPGGAGATHFERHQLAIVCLSMEQLLKRGRRALFHARSLLRSTDGVSDDPAVLREAAWDFITRHHIRRDASDPDRLRRYDAGALVRDSLPFDAVQAIACAGPESEAEVLAWAMPPHIEVIQRPKFFW